MVCNQESVTSSVAGLRQCWLRSTPPGSSTQRDSFKLCCGLPAVQILEDVGNGAAASRSEKGPAECLVADCC